MTTSSSAVLALLDGHSSTAMVGKGIVRWLRRYRRYANLQVGPTTHFNASLLSLSGMYNLYFKYPIGLVLDDLLRQCIQAFALGLVSP